MLVLRHSVLRSRECSDCTHADWLQVASPLFIAGVCTLQRLNHTVQTIVFNALIAEGIILHLEEPVVWITVHRTWTSLLILLGLVVIATVVGPFSSTGVTYSILFKIALDWRKYFTFVSEEFVPLASRAAKIAAINQRARAGGVERADSAARDEAKPTSDGSFRVQNPLSVVTQASKLGSRSPSSPHEAIQDVDAANVLQTVNTYAKACVTLTEKELFWVS